MARVKYTKEEADLILPSAPSKIENVDPRQLTYTLIAEPKWGKTTFFCNFPDTVLLAFEQGHTFQSAYKLIIDCWDARKFEPYIDDYGQTHVTMVQAVAAIVASDRFKFVVFDTADMAAKMCSDFHLDAAGYSHLGDIEFGKLYDTCLNTPFRQEMGRLMTSGRGMGFITHSKVKSVKFDKVEKNKKETTLPGGIQHLIISQSDLILNGEYGRKPKGSDERDRVLRTKGDNELLAGSRVKGIKIPDRYVVDTMNQFDQWASFFKDTEAADKEYHNYLVRSKLIDEAEQTEEEPEKEPEPERKGEDKDATDEVVSAKKRTRR